MSALNPRRLRFLPASRLVGADSGVGAIALQLRSESAGDLAPWPDAPARPIHFAFPVDLAACAAWPGLAAAGPDPAERLHRAAWALALAASGRLHRLDELIGPSARDLHLFGPEDERAPARSLCLHMGALAGSVEVDAAAIAAELPGEPGDEAYDAGFIRACAQISRQKAQQAFEALRPIAPPWARGPRACAVGVLAASLFEPSSGFAALPALDAAWAAERDAFELAAALGEPAPDPASRASRL